MVTAVRVLCSLIAFGGIPCAASSGMGWHIIGDGQWQMLRQRPDVAWGSCPAGETSATADHLEGQGPVIRCLVEPGPTVEAAGIAFGATEDSDPGYTLLLGGTPGVGGVMLEDVQGAVLWQDAYAPWSYYTPYLLEAVTEPGRCRVQMFSADGGTLLAQSEWIDLAGAEPAQSASLRLVVRNGVARFQGWSRADSPLSPIVPDSPTKMRLVSGGASPWVIVGSGDWRWTSPDKTVIRQGADVERSTAINKELGGAEGTWRCRVAVEKGAGGAGMFMQADEELTRGFTVWLGGQYGAGGLMLYRHPGTALWSSEQDTWHYDTQYLLEGTISKDKVSCRMLDASGTAVIAASPEFDLTAEEIGRPGHIGFMTWKGKARFWDFSEDTRAGEPENTAGAPASDLGAHWSAIEGEWRWADDTQTAIEAVSTPAALLWLGARAAKASYSATVTAQEGTTSVALLFQAGEALDEGFELRLSQGVALVTLGGRTLWEKRDFDWRYGSPYTLEGHVVTDRVSVRVLDAGGNVLAQSEDTYISDTNNARVGLLGFRCAGGQATFSNWSIRPSE